VVGKRKIRIEDDTKIAQGGGGRDCGVVKGNDRGNEFRSLLWSTNDEKFSYRWIESKLVHGKPMVKFVQSGG